MNTIWHRFLCRLRQHEWHGDPVEDLTVQVGPNWRQKFRYLGYDLPFGPWLSYDLPQEPSSYALD